MLGFLYFFKEIQDGRAVLGSLNLIVLVDEFAFLGDQKSPSFGRDAPVKGELFPLHEAIDASSLSRWDTKYFGDFPLWV